MANKLKSTKGEPVEIPGASTWCVKVVISVEDDRKNQVGGQELFFYHGTSKVHSDITNEAGLCEYTYNFPVSGNVMSEVISIIPEPSGSGNIVNLTLTYKKPSVPPQRVDRLVLRAEGNYGKYAVIATVFDQNNAVMNGVDVHFFEVESMGRLVELPSSPKPTNSSGFVYFSLPDFKEKNKRFLAVAGGAVEDFSLLGPLSVSAMPPTKIKEEDLDEIIDGAKKITGRWFTRPFKVIYYAWMEGRKVGLHDKEKQRRMFS